MIVTAITDPSALDQKYFNDQAYRSHAQMFLQGVLKNGLLICDQEYVLLQEMALRISAQRKDKKLFTLFEEILKNKRQRIVSYKVPISGSDTQKICRELERHLPPDVVIANPDDLQHFRNFCSESQVITFSDYLNSEYEEEREKYFTWIPPLHQLEFHQCKDLFIRIVRFAKYLRIYDKQIGKANNLSGFLRGIRFILQLWNQHGYFKGEHNAFVDIYTSSYRPENEYTHRENAEKIRRIKKNLIDKLQKEFPWTIKLHIKRDASDIHARYLQTQSSILLMERGFDFLKNSSSVKHTEIQLRPSASKYLCEIRNLPNLTV